jgi:hypothetical protein
VSDNYPVDVWAPWASGAEDLPGALADDLPGGFATGGVPGHPAGLSGPPGPLARETSADAGGFLPVLATGPELVAPGPLDPDLTDPARSDPRVAAARYRALLAVSDEARAKFAERRLARQEGDLALARRHREAAEEIRSRIENVWRQVAEPLAQHGLNDLDQLRLAPDGSGEPGAGTAGAAGAAALTDPARRGRPVARAGRAARRGARTGARTASPAVHGSPGWTGEGDRAGPVAGLTVDPATAPAEAYRLCLEAMSQAAELRAVSRPGSAASAGLLTGAGCALVAGLVAVARIFLDAAALPCLAAGAVACAALVAVGVEGAGARAVSRAALMGAGTAGAAVIATLRFVPPEPAGVVASLASLALALRFGLGFGAPAAGGTAGKGSAPAARKRR